MVSHKHKFICTSINKTACTTIRKALHPEVHFKNRRLFHKHAKTQNMIDGVTRFYFKFSFVRNPWDRMVSMYFFRLRTNSLIKVPRIRKKFKGTPKIQFNDWLYEVFDPNSVYHHGNNCVGSQLNFLTDRQGNMLNDFVGRFENLQEDFNKLCDLLTIPRRILPVRNSTKHKHFSDYYNKDTVALVRKHHGVDAEYFGYEFVK